MQVSAAIIVIAGAIFLSFAYADRVQGLLGQGGTDIAVRLSAFILFCLGLQILWSGCSELLAVRGPRLKALRRHNGGWLG